MIQSAKATNVYVALTLITFTSPQGPVPYGFNYAVNDDYKGTNFGQSEKSDGNNVWGSYTVALPDGRKQHVNLTPHL